VLLHERFRDLFEGDGEASGVEDDEVAGESGASLAGRRGLLAAAGGEGEDQQQRAGKCSAG
jgi:hypothetical protein